MGREIRRVPKGWEHPRDERGNYQPMFDKIYEGDKWIEACCAWHRRDVVKLLEIDEDMFCGCDPDEIFRENPYYWEWTDNPPNREWYRHEFDAPADHFQIYENVSEGTPVSPVFESKAEMTKWLISQGHDPETAARFVDTEWAPSMVMYKRPNGTGEIRSGIDSYDLMRDKEGGDGA